jgi:hypothetical protein
LAGTKGKSPASDVPLDSGASTSRSSENGRDRIKDSHELVKSGKTRRKIEGKK